MWPKSSSVHYVNFVKKNLLQFQRYRNFPRDCFFGAPSIVYVVICSALFVLSWLKACFQYRDADSVFISLATQRDGQPYWKQALMVVSNNVQLTDRKKQKLHGWIHTSKESSKISAKNNTTTIIRRQTYSVNSDNKIYVIVWLSERLVWGVHEREGKKGGLKERNRWPGPRPQDLWQIAATVVKQRVVRYLNSSQDISYN